MLRYIFLVMCAYASLAGAALADQPAQYQRQHNFTDHTQNFPNLPQDGGQMDDEYNAIKTTLDQTLFNLNLIQRDDGELRDHSVGVDQLKDEISIGINPVGDWATATVYDENDAVWEDSILYRCLISHTSGVFTTDLGNDKWEPLVDFKTYLDQASSSADTATDAAASAATSSSNASSSAASAALEVANLSGTSSSSVSIGIGTKTFTTQASKHFTAGTPLLIVDNSAPTVNYMSGVASSYSSTTLAVNVTTIGGSGTISNWTIMVGGFPGPAGPTGPAGATGNGTGDVLAANHGSEFTTSASTFRTNIGLGSIATQAANNVSITGGAVGVTADFLITKNSPVFKIADTTGGSHYFKFGVDSGQFYIQQTDNSFVFESTPFVIDTDAEVLHLEGSASTLGGNKIFTAGDTNLAALNGLTSASDKCIKFTGSGSAAVFTCTTAGLAILDDADASAQRTTLGLGTAAVASTGTSAGNVIVLDGDAKLPAVDGSALTNLASSGALTLVSAQTASNSSALVFTGLSSSCSSYRYVFSNIRPTTNFVSFQTFGSVNGGSSYLAASTGVGVTFQLGGGGGSTPSPTYTNATAEISGSAGNTAGLYLDGYMDLFSPSNASSFYKYYSSDVRVDGFGSFVTKTQNVFTTAPAAVTATKFKFSSGNISSGTIYEYCLKSS